MKLNVTHLTLPFVMHCMHMHWYQSIKKCTGIFKSLAELRLSGYMQIPNLTPNVTYLNDFEGSCWAMWSCRDLLVVKYLKQTHITLGLPWWTFFTCSFNAFQFKNSFSQKWHSNLQTRKYSVRKIFYKNL